MSVMSVPIQLLAAVFGFDGTDHRADVVAEVGADVEALAFGGHQVGPAVEVLDIVQIETRGVVVDVNLEGEARVLVDADLVGRHRDAHLALSDLVARFLGEDRPYRHITVKPKGWLARLFGA